jgi:two-component system, LytTR family, sensor kinase
MALLSLLSAPAAPQAHPPQAEPVSTGEFQSAAGPWALILGVGGACWLALAGLANLGEPLVSLSPASLGYFGAQQLCVFLAATAGYRATLALAWPSRATARVGVVILTLLIACAVAVLAPQLADAVLGALWDPPAPLAAQPAAAAHWIAAAQRFLPSYLLGLCATLLTCAAGDSCRARRLATALEGECAGAHMRMLSAQLQPHFLFNALHAISVLVDDSPRRASAMIARLGDFLRHALESSRWPWTDLASELAGVEAYLAVQQMRFGDTLRVSIEAAADTLGASVPALLLQPLVENAIEHGRSAQGAVLGIHIAASVAGARLRIVVLNSHSGLHAELTAAQFGVGLGNVEQRLRAAYGADAHLSIGPDARGGATACVDLPRRTFGPARSAGRQQP